jgi:NAD(P)-dependent dehydrogenase (short-subunit alcohol dehydrogenase family)
MAVSLMRAAAVAAAVVACVLAIGAAVRMQWPTCSDVVRRTPRETLGAIVGRTVVVTGGNSGIGLCLSTTFARLGARVIVGCRDARASVEGARVLPLDLTSPQSVDAFAAAVSRERPSLVVFNAGMFPADAMQLVEATGIERCFATNHVGHFQLARAVRASLAADARFVFVASGSQRGPSLDDAASAEQWRRVARPDAGEYSALRAYGSSKLANALCARYFHLLGIDSRAVWPGALIGTGISRHRSALERFVFRHVISHFTMSADQGAAGVLWVCLQPGLSGRCIEHSRAVPDVSDAAAVALATVTGELLPQKNVGQGAEEA